MPRGWEGAPREHCPVREARRRKVAVPGRRARPAPPRGLEPGAARLPARRSGTQRGLAVRRCSARERAAAGGPHPSLEWKGSPIPPKRSGPTRAAHSGRERARAARGPSRSRERTRQPGRESGARGRARRRNRRAPAARARAGSWRDEEPRGGEREALNPRAVPGPPEMKGAGWTGARCPPGEAWMAREEERAPRKARGSNSIRGHRRPVRRRDRTAPPSPRGGPRAPRAPRAAGAFPAVRRAARCPGAPPRRHRHRREGARAGARPRAGSAGARRVAVRADPRCARRRASASRRTGSPAGAGGAARCPWPCAPAGRGSHPLWIISR